MVTPPKVMVIVPLGMAAPPTVNTTDVASVGALVLTVLGSMMEGVTPGAKKPEGYLIVMVPAAGSDVGIVKEMVTVLPVTAAMR